MIIECLCGMIRLHHLTTDDVIDFMIDLSEHAYVETHMN